MEVTKVLIAGVAPGDKENLVEALTNVDYIRVADGAETADDVIEFLENNQVDVVLADAYIPGNGYTLAENIAELFPGTAVILIERELREETMRQALFCGANDVLLLPVAPAMLVDSIYRSHRAEKKKQTLARERTVNRKKGHRGQVITVFGTKGGIGKTFAATNLAVSLARHNGSRVALVDLDLDFGNVALALNIIPKFTISDVINDITLLDQDLLESYLIAHSSGVKLLAANAQPQMTEFVSAEHVSMILKLLQNAFDYVVVDMPARFYSPVDPALQDADILLLVATPEVVTLRNIKSCLNTLAMLKYPSAKIRILLNKVDPRDDIRVRDVEATLNSKIFAAVQADYRMVGTSMNQGIPVVILYPRSKISRSFHDLACAVSGLEKTWKEAASEPVDKDDGFREVGS